MKVPYSAFYQTFTISLAILTTTGSMPVCPNGCRCTGGAPATSLTVDCQRNTNINREQLSKQLDSLLSSNLTYGRLRSLRIINTPLTHVPRSVCRLTTLTQLHLDFNRLTRLPDNCLTNLTALTSLTASYNSITELQDGLFDALDKLVTLTLDHNSISSIGLRVFNSSAMLTSLMNVDLQFNRIQTLEPWPYYVGLNGHLGNVAIINLDVNNISTFTNMMGWKAHCDMRVPYLKLVLDRNPMKHVTDILRGWNISLTISLCLQRLRTPHRSFTISLFRTYLECDCIDFFMYKYVHSSILKTSFLSNAYCNKPDTLYGKRIDVVPLDQFACELTERCPPGCRCVHRPANATLHVYCSNTNLTVFPLELPELPKSYTKYKLDFSNNRQLRRLEHRDYLVNTSILDVSNCNLDSIDFEM